MFSYLKESEFFTQCVSEKEHYIYFYHIEKIGDNDYHAKLFVPRSYHHPILFEVRKKRISSKGKIKIIRYKNIELESTPFWFQQFYKRAAKDVERRDSIKKMIGGQ